MAQFRATVPTELSKGQGKPPRHIAQGQVFEYNGKTPSRTWIPLDAEAAKIQTEYFVNVRKEAGFVAKELPEEEDSDSEESSQGGQSADNSKAGLFGRKK
jgi:hypothetical protein